MKSSFLNRNYLIPFLFLILLAFVVSILLPRYRVEDSNDSQVSWYGGRFHGRTAASGRIYNMLDFTAAHCSRPMGSLLRITNLSNDKSVVVEVTDRGPYKMNRNGRVVRPLQPHPRREVDLSYRAARKLDLLNSGVADARIEHLAE
jgi:peptidoglycan lytic transglycosylase